MSSFFGIGVGPGDPELLTLKAINKLKELDVLFVPLSKKGVKSVAYNIVKNYTKEAKIIEVVFPMIKDSAQYEEYGKKVADMIQEYILQNNDVGFITIGDPLIYSTYGYILKALLKNNIKAVTIPGIPSFCAAASATNTILVEKDEILSIIPSNIDSEKFNKAVNASDNAVFIKPKLNTKLVSNNIKNNEYVLVKKCGLDEQEIIFGDIEALKNNNDYLSIVLSTKKR